MTAEEDLKVADETIELLKTLWVNFGDLWMRNENGLRQAFSLIEGAVYSRREKAIDELKSARFRKLYHERSLIMKALDEVPDASSDLLRKLYECEKAIDAVDQ